MKMSRNKRRTLRHARVRRKVSGTAEIPRLCVHRSLRYMYAQVIDDTAGKTILAASTHSKAKAAGAKTMKNVDAARELGAEIARLCSEKNISRVVFDRGGYLFHGRVKAVADGARAAGLRI